MAEPDVAGIHLVVSAPGIPGTPKLNMTLKEHHRSMILQRLLGRGPDEPERESNDETTPGAETSEAVPETDIPGRVDEPSAADDLRRVSSEIESLPPEELRFLAGYSYVLARVALADHDVNEAELISMERALTVVGHLTEDQAVLVVQVARNMAVLYGATEDFVVTREFAASSTPEQREDLLRTAFAIGLADHELSTAETDELDEIGKELGFRSDEIDAIRAESRSHLLRMQGGGETALP